MSKYKNWLALLLSLLGGVALTLVVLVGLGGGTRLAHAGSAAPQAELHVCTSDCVYTTVQSAIDAAHPGDLIKVAGGDYTGVFTRNGIKQVAYITQSLTLQGGYTPTNWITPDPVAHPTVLDAESGGRVMVIWGSITVHIEGVELTGGSADGLGGCLFGLPPKNPAGGGVYIRDATVTLSDTLIANNVAAVSKNQQGCGGGLYAQSANLTVVGSTIRENQSSTGKAGYSRGGGLMVVYGTVSLENNHVLNNASGYSGYAGEGGGIVLDQPSTASLVDNLVSGNTSMGANGAGLLLKGPSVTLAHNQIVNNTILNSAATAGGLSCSGACTLTGNLIMGNQAYYGAGASISGNPVKLDNNVFIDNTAPAGGYGSGLLLMNATATLRQNTLARNSGGDGTAVYLWNSPSQFNNTLIADSQIGIYKRSGSFNVTLDRTLWSSILTNTVNAGGGGLSNLNPVTGPSGFDTDGYHITRYSAALEQGGNAGVADDIDGEARPLPAGTSPDIGADEYAYSPGAEFTADKAAFAPQWVADADHPAGRLHQRYLLRFYYGSPEPDPPALLVTVTDTLPTGLAYLSDYQSPSMSFQQQGQLLTWQAVAPVPRGQSGEIELDTIYDSPEPGRSLTNTAALLAGNLLFDLQAVTQVPVIAPLITAPGRGEICTGTVTIKGMAQPGVTVTLYANNDPIAEILTDENGLFAKTYEYPGGENTLKARACASSGACSPDSSLVELIPTKSFWCPQRSTWRGGSVVYRFRDGTGKFSTQNWAVPGYYGFVHTQLDLYICNCPGSDEPPNSVWVIADGATYDGVEDYPFYHFTIGQAHNVSFHAQCVIGGEAESDSGSVLIDPDGFIFDVTQGFDPLSPTLHSLSGVTVTAYVSMPAWGGWVPWPAHLYDDQVNPQVTGADGYFAFFTPPGFYYLMVTGKDGYQPWRSPVIQVINEIVHVNVPLTPESTGVAQVALEPDGPNPALLTIAPGDTVTWQAAPDPLASVTDWVRWTDNPLLRLLSTRDPLSDTLGFDGGMLAAGRVYSRQFTTPGTYAYTDGAGHSGQVVVTGSFYTYIPLVTR